MGQGGVVAKQTRVVQWGGVGVHLRPHAYQAAAERLLAAMGANFRDVGAFGTDERQPAPMGAGTVRVTVPAELTMRGPAEPAPPAAILRPRSIAAWIPWGVLPRCGLCSNMVDVLLFDSINRDADDQTIGSRQGPCVS